MKLRKYLYTFSILLVLVTSVNAEVFNVKKFGAVGDGTSDDSAAITKAKEALAKAKSGTLFFPEGKYLYKKRGSALVFKGLSNITVKFEPGAVLLIDNLKADGRGNGHGIIFQKPGKNISLENVWIKWKIKSKFRSCGDGIRFDGYPDDSKTISHIKIINCRVVNAPQTGAVIMGCSDITVKNFRPENTNADGLHFNACRRVNVNGVRGINTGDDTLAFVTYYHPSRLGAYRDDLPPFNQPHLGKWNNTDSTATNIYSEGGRANGIRISGGKSIKISKVKVIRKGFAGIQLDAAKKTKKNRIIGWTYLASRDIQISDVTVEKCTFGFIVRTLNYKPDDPKDFWLPEISLKNICIQKCRYGLYLLDSGNIKVSGVKSDSSIQLSNARGKYHISDVQLKNTNLYIRGVQGKTFQGWKGNREPLLHCAKKDLSNLIDKDIVLKNINIVNGKLNISDCAGVRIDQLKITTPPKYAICIYKSKNCKLNNVTIKSKKIPLHISKVHNLLFSNWLYSEQSKLMCAGKKERKQIILKNVRKEALISKNKD